VDGHWQGAQEFERLEREGPGRDVATHHDDLGVELARYRL
jgi:hypothetical protein